jgi:tRNA-binding EMAP/Myf-like protein
MAIEYLDAWIAELEGAGVKPAAGVKHDGTVGGILESLGQEAASPSPKEPPKEAAKKEKKPKAKAGGGGGGGGSSGGGGGSQDKAPLYSPEGLHMGLLDFRVGKIVEAWPHPESEKVACLLLFFVASVCGRLSLFWRSRCLFAY